MAHFPHELASSSVAARPAMLQAKRPILWYQPRTGYAPLRSQSHCRWAWWSRDMTHARVCNDSICGLISIAGSRWWSWLICVCTVTHACVWHDSSLARSDTAKKRAWAVSRCVLICFIDPRVRKIRNEASTWSSRWNQFTLGATGLDIHFGTRFFFLWDRNTCFRPHGSVRWDFPFLNERVHMVTKQEPTWPWQMITWSDYTSESAPSPEFSKVAEASACVL